MIKTSGVVSNAGVRFQPWGMQPLCVSYVRHTGFVYPEWLGCFVLEDPDHVGYREMLSLRGSWALIPFHSHSGYVFVE